MVSGVVWAVGELLVEKVTGLLYCWISDVELEYLMFGGLDMNTFWQRSTQWQWCSRGAFWNHTFLASGIPSVYSYHGLHWPICQFSEMPDARKYLWFVSSCDDLSMAFLQCQTWLPKFLSCYCWVFCELPCGYIVAWPSVVHLSM